MSAFSHHGLCELLAGGSLTHPNEITLNCKSTLKNPISRITSAIIYLIPHQAVA